MKKKIFFLMFFAITNDFYPQKKASDDGFVILANAGSMSGGLGILMQYQARIDLFTFLTPFAGTGIELGSQDLKGIWPGFALGANIEHGKYHRVFSGITYGSMGVGFETIKNEIINKHILIGPSIIIGYKGIGKKSIVWLINVGMAYLKNPASENKKYYKYPTAGIGFGYKF